MKIAAFRTREGPPRLLPPVWLLLALGTMVLLHRVTPGPTLLSGPARWVSGVIVVLGMSLVVGTAQSFRRARTTIRPFEVSEVLLRGGLYRYSRNPIYLGMVVTLAGAALMLGTTTPWIMVPAFVTVISRRFIRMEERMLEAQFGEEYREYCAAVRRWV